MVTEVQKVGNKKVQKMRYLRPLGWVLLFLATCSIVVVGLFNLMLLLPDWAVHTRLLIPSNMPVVASISGLLLVSLGFYKYCKKLRRLKEHRAALLILHYLDPDVYNSLQDVLARCGLPPWENLWWLIWCNIDQYKPKRNPVHGLSLLMHETISKYPVGQSLVYRELYELKNYSPSMVLKRLDNLILYYLDDEIKREYPREVYFLRLNLLRDYLGAQNEGRCLVYEPKDELYDYAKDDAVWQFCKHVLNKFYTTHDCKGDYAVQPVLFNSEELRKRFSEVAQEGSSDSKRIIGGSWLRPQMSPQERIPYERWKSPALRNSIADEFPVSV